MAEAATAAVTAEAEEDTDNPKTKKEGVLKNALFYAILC